jgi:hypothetical protein
LHLHAFSTLLRPTVNVRDSPRFFIHPRVCPRERGATRYFDCSQRLQLRPLHFKAVSPPLLVFSPSAVTQGDKSKPLTPPCAWCFTKRGEITISKPSKFSKPL